jgi:carboxyl-terminal processing protease
MKHLISYIALSLVLSTGLYSQTVYEQTYKFGRVLELIDRYYVDTVNDNKLVESAIVEMLKNLDPHSTYITSDEVKEMNEPLLGNFEGIGISFNILNDTIFIISPISGGPSEKVGIRAGDRIVKVDDKNVAGIGITTKGVYDLLRGNKGTKVKVTIVRRNQKKPIDFTITRDKIPIYSLDAAYMVNDSVGYIKLNRFALTTMGEFTTALDQLKKEGMTALILDLTGNGGGYLETAHQLADQFLGKGKLIVYTKGLHSERHDYVATQDGDFEKGHLIILIDEGSASASEIVTGAVQDWDRGIIIGRRSFGKGLVQRPFLLPDQSMIRLTIARYYTPTGRLIQKPYSNGKTAYDEDIIDRYNNGELMHADSIHFPDSLKYHTLVSSRTVYGGGGIMPDFFVPIDTSYYSDYYRDIIRNGILNQFLLEYVDANRVNFRKEYPQFSSFDVNFKVDDKLMSKLIRYAAKEGLPENKAGINTSRNELKLLVKAYIARDLWNTSEFFEVLNTRDANFKKAVDVLNNWGHYKSLLKNK